MHNHYQFKYLRVRGPYAFVYSSTTVNQCRMFKTSDIEWVEFGNPSNLPKVYIKGDACPLRNSFHSIQNLPSFAAMLMMGSDQKTISFIRSVRGE
jgi:hypothetical protein